jgi:hypothetical protein
LFGVVRNRIENSKLFDEINEEMLINMEQLCAHPQEDNCINTTSGIITLKISEWSKITKVTRIHHGCIAATMYSRIFYSILKTYLGDFKSHNHHHHHHHHNLLFHLSIY